jgi:hypothetical protein
MQRPASVIVFGILNIVFGVFGVLALAGTIVLFFMANASRNPIIKLMQESAVFHGWMMLSIPLGLLSGAALLAAGIGLLCFKSWARKLSIGYAIYAIVFGAIGLAIHFIFLVPRMLEEAQRLHGPEAGGAIGGAVGGGIGGCVGMIYPILLLIFMTRPKLVAAFQTSR